MDLADLLVSSEPEATTLLEAVRSDWPLNGKAASLPVPDGSQRVRLRRVISALQGWGLSVSGAEPSQHVIDAQISFSGSFNPYGDLHGSLLHVNCEDEHIEQVQMALQAEGFPAVVSYERRLLVATFEADDEQVRWMEMGQIAPIQNMSPERLCQWLEDCPALSDVHDIRRLDIEGIEPSEARPWVEVSTDPDEDGDSYKPFCNHPGYLPGWMKSGLSPEQARDWIVAESYAFRDFSTVKEWIDAGWSAQEASAWMNMERWSCDPDDVKALQKEGFTVKHALRIQRADGSSYDVSRLQRLDLKPSEITAWIECGVTGEDKVSQFSELGLKARDVRRWNRAAEKGGRDKPLTISQIKTWIDAGRSIDSAEPWLCLHHRFISLDLVKEWEKEGIGSDGAADWARADVPELGSVKAWKAAHSRCEDPVLVGDLVKAGITPEQAELVLDKLG